MSNQVVDQNVRSELLNPAGSYIVQAPAGSGKTELLTQRILALLAVAEKPENILAITFTRKAAAEMQSRVVSALILATGDEPDASHEKHRWHLARKVLQRDQEKGWHLIENASRLNMTTIDSLAASLSGALPLLSQTGALPEIADNAKVYYREAAEDLLQRINEGGQLGHDIRALLKHKDNNLNQVIDLLGQMLARRLQWMASMRDHGRQLQTEALTDSLKTVVEEKLVQTYELIPQDIVAELPPLLNQAGEVFRQNPKSKKEYVKAIEDLGPIGPPDYGSLGIWKAVAELFLQATKGKGFLKSFTKASGFPVEKDGRDEAEKLAFKSNKAMATEIAGQLASIEGAVEAFEELRMLPDDAESSFSQQALGAVVALLPMAVAHLKLVFKKYNAIDFSELSLASLDALGHEDMPSDLALAMDYKLEHILIDEFQDTSTPQIELLKLLTAGWDDSTQRTLFLVGDPMQSIYRFRDANVSLFMQIREQGIGQIKPAFRQLQVNFRSNGRIVNWVNRNFRTIMPEKEDLAFAAVSYASSVAFNAESDPAQVKCMLTVDAEDHHSQANQVVKLVENHLAENRKNQTKKTLAILARGRKHLAEIIQILNQKAIDYQAVEIDKLSQKMVVRDLTSLAFALCDQYDQLSWSAVMRSPWFGLSLNDIYKISRDSEAVLPYPEKIWSVIDELSDEGQERIRAVLPLLEDAIALKGRKPVKKWLYGTFIAVGGLAQLDFESDKDDLMVCLELLSEQEAGGELNDRKAIFDAIDNLYAAPNPAADGQVQLMTIHKSKGLEFDTVVLPRLEAGKPQSDQPLLIQSEMVDSQGQVHNLLAISKQAGEETDRVYKYIEYLEKRKLHFEDQRVLYVAATRAKSKLFLIGNVSSDEKKGGYKKPRGDSYLSMLWPGVEEEFSVIVAANTLADTTSTEDVGGTGDAITAVYDSRQIKRTDLSRVSSRPEQADLEFSDNDELEPKHSGETKEALPASNSEYWRSSPIAIAIGKVIHRQLQWVSERFHADFELPENWADVSRAQLLSEYIFPGNELLEDAVAKVCLGVQNTLNDELGRQLLSANTDAGAELVLHKKLEEGNYLTRIIDRTFVKDGKRWIVDYKSSVPEAGESQEAFLEREKRQYLAQLTDYFKMYKQLEDKPTVAGLYFPLLSHFECLIEG